ncbi:MAG: hydrogenase formation protein HypD [Planctomyces sp.]|nr:hydrogenase formation protein HypD [Planctomyces sp.]
MKYLDEFRDAGLARRLIDRIRRTATRPWVLMEVCGGQTHGLLRHGLDEALAGVVELIHGPGCPVCVTPAEAIDFACRLSLRPNTVLASFGDMLRVPGGVGSLNDARSQGGSVRIVYSPLDAVELAAADSQRQIVFFAVGFETTLPATALAVLQAEARGLANFSVLQAHVRVLPAMEAIVDAPDNRVQGFLAAGHVCTITGYDDYRDLARRCRVPIAVAGFEPVDLLEGILECVTQLEQGRCDVSNRYERSVRREGNPAAQGHINRVFAIADRPWRGLGTVPRGGFEFRPDFHAFDARRRYPDPAPTLPVLDDGDCRSGDVLSGRIRPHECPSYGVACTPEMPLGAPMVSSEGACAAYYRYSTRRPPLACPLPR